MADSETERIADEARVAGREALRRRALELDEHRQYEEAAKLRRCMDDLRVMDEVAARRHQHAYLYDQWGLRVAFCEKREPHDWHGWVGGNHDLRCPGLPEVKIIELETCSVCERTRLA